MSADTQTGPTEGSRSSQVELAKAMRWGRITLTQTGPTAFDAVFEGDEGTGEGTLDLTPVDPLPPGEELTWPDMARAVRDEFGCDVYVKLPDDGDGEPLQVCFLAGAKPWTRHTAERAESAPCGDSPSGVPNDPA